MKELCPSLPPFTAYAEHHLLESMPEEDQAALLPIIKMAFPILEWGGLQSFCPGEVAINMQMRHNIVQMDYQQWLPLNKAAVVNADDRLLVDEQLYSSHAHHGFQGTQVSGRAACTMKDDKLLLSLGSACSETCSNMDASIKNLPACSSSEYSWLHQQENRLGLTSCTSGKPSESNAVRGVGVVEAINMPGNSKESFPLANNKRKSGSTYGTKLKRFQLSNHAVTDDVESSQANKMRCSKESRSESMLAMRVCSDKLTATHVAGPAILDATMELHKLERCHRTNGKQWRCAKNVTPGSLYCELHHKYRSKFRIKESLSPGKAFFLEQKRAAFLKEMQVNVARCRRTDGKLWQCSKQVMPGSTYCENHHNRYRKKKKQLKAASLAAGKKKPVVEQEGHGTKLEEGNGLDETSLHSTIKRDGLMQLCYLVAGESQLELRVCGGVGEKEVETNVCGAFIGKHEGGLGRKSNQNLQMEDVAGLVSTTDGQKQGMVEPVLPHLSSPKRKISANGLGQFTEGDVSREALCALREGSRSEAWHASSSKYSDAEPQDNKDGGFMRCLRNDGRQWRCSQLSKPGSSYCEHHQKFQPKTTAGKIKQAKRHKLEGSPNNETRSSNDDTGDQIIDSVDDCFAGIVCHKEPLQELEQSKNIISQEVCSLNQSLRKDGKGWQCLEGAKEWRNYCRGQLEYWSKRTTYYTHENEDGSSIFTTNGVSPFNKASTAISTISNQGLSAEELLHKHSSDNPASSLVDPFDAFCKHEHATHIVEGETMPQKSSSVNDNLDSSPFNAFCEHGHSTHTPEVEIMLQGSSNVNESIGACASVSNRLDEINPPQQISEQGIHTPFESHIQEDKSILCSHNQESCIAHDSSSRTICNEGLYKEEINTPIEKKSPQYPSDTIGGVTCDKEQQSLHESKQLTGTMPQDVSSLKQCQRKDGKGWQCSKKAKQGQNYCLHHLDYLRERRNASKSCRKANYQLDIQDSRAIFTGDGLSLCRKVSLSAIPSVLREGLSARKPLSKSCVHSAHDVHSS